VPINTDEITLLNPLKILRTEHHCEERADTLFHKIITEGIWSVPLTVEKNSLCLMDGHHRLQVALRLELDFVPCVLIDYSEVDVQTRRSNMIVTPEEIIKRGLAGNLYPEKSTRHMFKKDFSCHLPLNSLNYSKAC